MDRGFRVSAPGPRRPLFFAGGAEPPREPGKDGQPCRAKAFDTFAPIGPCIATDIEPNAVQIETYLNGECRQASNTKMFIFPVEDVIARVSQVMTLLPGDVISTGTPAGIGPMRSGDRVEVRIEGIGTLKNGVMRLP